MTIMTIIIIIMTIIIGYNWYEIQGPSPYVSDLLECLVCSRKLSGNLSRKSVISGLLPLSHGFQPLPGVDFGPIKGGV
jgi:hypothetical protein